MDFLEAFEDAMRELGYGEAPERRMSPADISRRAREIAAAEGIKYKSARRRLERRRTTGAESRGQPNRRFAARIRREGLRVHAVLQMDMSPKDRRDMRERRIDLTIPPSYLVDMARALDRGDLQEAAGEFFSALMRAYEEVGADEESSFEGAAIGEVSALDISWGPYATSADELGDLPF